MNLQAVKHVLFDYKWNMPWFKEDMNLSRNEKWAYRRVPQFIVESGKVMFLRISNP